MLRLVSARVVLEDDGTLVGVSEVVLEIEGRSEPVTLRGPDLPGAREVPGDELTG